MFQEKGSIPILTDIRIFNPQMRGSWIVFLNQLKCGCCCLARVGMGFLTATSSAASNALVHFTRENLTESVVTVICLSCSNDCGFLI